MWFSLLALLVLAGWVDNNARRRKMSNPLLWGIGTLLLAIVVVPLYFATRHLKQGEIREGGTAWNFAKVFAILWTVLMLAAGISGLISAGDIVESYTSEAERAGASIGTAIGFGMVLGLWFVVLIGAFVIGLVLKKSSVVERGPTGPLARIPSGSRLITSRPTRGS